jgi:predicted ATP-binding protein involved in virulence
MHIERILLRDVGPFADVTIELPPGNDPDLADVYLLTGPNGSGKSTVLYAVAAMIAAGVHEVGGQILADEILRPPSLAGRLLSQRMHSPAAEVALQTDGGETLSASQERALSSWNRPPRLRTPSPFDGQELLEIATTGGLTVYGRGDELSRYALRANAFQADGQHGTFDWAAFAYAGIRQVVDVPITAIQEPKNSPFENSLSFRKTADTNLLANWIVSQNYRRLKAKEAGDLANAEQLERSVRRIERIIADIIEDPSFGFVITAKDDDVRVRWHGVTVGLGVLPDGLQSVVSWIADLLMRLNRIPWQDNTPVEQRQFLLLLDEIDIHLHPTWQRRVLPLVQHLFPNAQIIASTHSPFVVGSLADGRVISLGLQGSAARVVHEDAPQLGVSYSAVLRSIFGIESEFDVDTEHKLQDFHEARKRLLGGDARAQADVDRIADELKQRSEELRGLIALEMGQLRRQLAQRAAP